MKSLKFEFKSLKRFEISPKKYVRKKHFLILGLKKWKSQQPISFNIEKKSFFSIWSIFLLIYVSQLFFRCLKYNAMSQICYSWYFKCLLQETFFINDFRIADGNSESKVLIDFPIKNHNCKLHLYTSFINPFRNTSANA